MSDSREENNCSCFKIPRPLKIIVTIACSIFIILWMVYFYYYIHNPGIYSSPEKLGLIHWIIYSLIIVIFMWLPWEQLSLSLRKIGPIEFERIITAHNNEQIEEIVYLASKILRLEDKVRAVDEFHIFTDSINELRVKNILIDFFNENNNKKLSLLEIFLLAIKNKKYAELASYDTPLVRIVLKDMVSKKDIKRNINMDGEVFYYADSIISRLE